MVERVPVLIVGAGPVGLALAGDLGWRGVRSVLVERRDGSVFQPKMDMVGIRSMEFCRRWGIVDEVESAGYNRGYVQDNAWVADLNSFEFGREEFPAPRDEKCPPQSPQHRERCPQNFFDPVLTGFAGRSGLSDIRYRTELISFTDHGDGVTATLRSVEDGRTYEVEADYLVGADGGASTVRTALGIEMAGEGTLTYTTNAIFRCDNLERLHDKKPAYRYIFIGPEGTWATLVAINGRDQWRFSLIGDGEHREATEEELRQAIVRAVGHDFDFEILSILPWVRQQLVAESYRRGRVFIAGDAAHLTSPTGGFGMNTGLLDIVNLSWKLVACLQGWGGDVLLDSYEIEQRPVAERNVGEASDNLRRMLNPRLSRPDPVIFDPSDMSKAAVDARNQFGDEYTAMMSREWHSIGIHLGYLYEGSPVVVPDGTPAPELEVSRYVQTARPGSRAPHIWLDKAQTQSVLDEFGLGFVLLRFDDRAVTGPLESAAVAMSVPLRRVDINNPEAAELYERALVLVRPDGQVAWRGDAIEGAVDTLTQVAGRTAPASATSPVCA
ncbi:FAD-dependent monooxygenase [Streptomyces sp. ITFR-16]|uniref:FAD-dependent monooxygenase n=1 Tax=Streptomyces sp. ITFR-16 TaxID=3075198 RepID=UPI00288B9213|nr:FAD-dependent monooxygenase [Streptomyces sp. ITFR-16]WNI21432.1 FAD-dependent monooxygenase [Streptomyces sp. ITFR-16]